MPHHLYFVQLASYVSLFAQSDELKIEILKNLEIKKIFEFDYSG